MSKTSALLSSAVVERSRAALAPVTNVSAWAAVFSCARKSVKGFNPVRDVSTADWYDRESSAPGGAGDGRVGNFGISRSSTSRSSLG